ncbi:MAG: hypothetical protein H6767_00090 [Candidatus Peribacteria bacterium]|nr:MAG: hypothetical protein H6767_00090 [Candidatus Peribacteria bacterium]
MDKDKGFSLRFAWKRDGELDVLNYGADTGTYGDFVGGNFFQFVPETDYTITQEVVLNTPGNADGYLGVVVNGKKVYESNTMVYRNNAEVQIDSLLFATFFGGSDESWATPNDTYLEIKNFRISDDFEYSMVK